MNEFLVLLSTAAFLGFLHTVLGPDHYIPFVAMSKAGNWSQLKTLWVTFLCGVAHVGSSVVLGLVGIGFGIGISHIEFFEEVRGEIAGWILLGFGIVYTLWGIYRAYYNTPHTHFHHHEDGSTHSHLHDHNGKHVHIHSKESVSSLTPWVLFTIFIFGPCEPFIPLLLYPAAQGHVLHIIAVTIVFAVVTIGTMMILVIAAIKGIELLQLRTIERYAHVIAGVTIILCGVSVQFLGL